MSISHKKRGSKRPPLLNCIIHGNHHTTSWVIIMIIRLFYDDQNHPRNEISKKHTQKILSIHSPNSWNDLSCGQVCTYCNHKSKHCKTCVEDLCLWCESEFHSFTPMLIALVRSFRRRSCQ